MMCLCLHCPVLVAGATMRSAPEAVWGANAGLGSARDFLEPIKVHHGRYTPQYSTVQYSTVQYSTVQYHTVQH